MDTTGYAQGGRRRPQIAVGDAVRIDDQDSMAFGETAIVEAIMEWGIKYYVPDFVHPKAKLLHTTRGRALWEEISPIPVPLMKSIGFLKGMGYTGDTCTICQGCRLTRNGNCMKCEDCGSTSGCS